MIDCHERAFEPGANRSQDQLGQTGAFRSG